MNDEVKQDDPAQSKRFMETAKEIKTEESGQEFEKIVSKVINLFIDNNPRKTVSVIDKS